VNKNFQDISFFTGIDNKESQDNEKSRNEITNVPLAQRLKPSSLDDYIGQDHILAKDKLLYRAIRSDRLTSLILYGPPGTGKTSLAQVIAKTTKANFVELNAVTCGVKDLREVIEEAKVSLSMNNKKTILFIDEIHRFNKSQQDALLPHVEKGTVILIGATTENPFFEVNKALLSRSMVFKLEPLSYDDLRKVIRRALSDKNSGFGNSKIIITDEAVEFICKHSNGDARRALNALELAVLTTNKNVEGVIHLNVNVIEECIQKKQINYDKTGDFHYDIISAFIKSMRGSDPMLQYIFSKNAVCR
jgi:putative ATPase